MKLVFFTAIVLALVGPSESIGKRHLKKTLTEEENKMDMELLSLKSNLKKIKNLIVITENRNESCTNETHLINYKTQTNTTLEEWNNKYKSIKEQIHQKLFEMHSTF